MRSLRPSRRRVSVGAPGGTVVTDALTRKAIREAERRLGFKLHFTQGSFRPRTPYSGTTHTGAGSLDVDTSPDGKWWGRRKTNHVAGVLRRVGFAAWPRDERDGMGRHIHAERIGPGLSTSAQWQVDEYDAGRSGLSSGKRDRYTYRPRPVRMTWLRGLRPRKTD